MWVQDARDGAAIAAVAIAGDNLDLRAGPQPGFDCRRFPVGQQVDDPAPFRIADQDAVSLPLAPCPVVETNDPGLSVCSVRRVSNAAQKGTLSVASRRRTSFTKCSSLSSWVRPKRRSAMVGRVVLCMAGLRPFRPEAGRGASALRGGGPPFLRSRPGARRGAPPV